MSYRLPHPLRRVHRHVQVLPDLVVPWPIIAVVLGVWVIYACIYVGMEDAEACGWVFFTLLAAIYPLLLAELVWGMAYLIAKQRTERRVKVRGAYERACGRGDPHRVTSRVWATLSSHV